MEHYGALFVKGVQEWGGDITATTTSGAECLGAEVNAGYTSKQEEIEKLEINA